MSRPLPHILCGLLLAALSVPCARAATGAEVRALAALGALVTVDDQFPAAEVRLTVAAAPGRLTVMGKGFHPSDARLFLTAGAVMLIDATYPAGEIVSLCQLGRGRVIVDPAGVSPDALRQVAAFGSHIKPGDGGATFDEKVRTLNAGGQAVVDKNFSLAQVANLVAAGKARVHVMAEGFRPGDVDLFVRGGAIVWVDRTLPAADARRLAVAAGLRLVMRADGWTGDDLRAFAVAKAQLLFTRDPRLAKRAAKFDRLHADSDPSSRSWQGGIARP